MIQIQFNNISGHQNSGICCGILQNINVMKIHDANECGAEHEEEVRKKTKL